jgi:hypothetical protein
MKVCIFFFVFLFCIAAVTVFAEEGYEEIEKGRITTTSPCLSCHESITPGIVVLWAKSKHDSENVDCYDCHKAKNDDSSGYEHNGYFVTAVPSPAYCASCHPKEVAENSRTKHAWGAFLGPLKPYYTKARNMGLDPFSQETAKKLDPEKMAKTAVTPLFPDSGILKRIGFLDDPSYTHNNVNLGCIECHGSFIIAEEDGTLRGWPNAGVGRVNPDGTLGSCTYCHSRHRFSVAEARKPESCGQCHLGPDHPQHEIYTESKHGNIFAAGGEDWNWEKPVNEWGPGDIDAPTCATCHMSGFGDAVRSTHDVGSRLYWELQPKKSVPQWKGPDELDFVLKRVPDLKQAQKGRAEMKAVCNQCHASKWTNGYFEEFDKVVSDYNMLWDYTDGLLAEAYAEGLLNKEIPVDETPEILHYLIWHHDGRRWRMGASMMGPDWTHWNGAVDTIMIKLGAMINDIEMRRKIKDLESR